MPFSRLRPLPLNSLRAKTLLALLLLAVVIVLPAALIGRSALEEVKTGLGISFARNHVLQNQQRILTLIRRDLALAQRLAGSTLTRRWFVDEDNNWAKEQFFAEADGYATSFADHSYFAVHAGSGHYYFNDGKQAYSRTPRYALKREAPDDAWFFSTIAKPPGDHINVNLDEKLRVTKVWFNIPVLDAEGRVLGIAGSGIDLSAFLQTYLHAGEIGVTSLVVNRDGAIQAHPDPAMIEYAALTKRQAEKTLYRLLADDGERQQLRQLLQRLATGQDGVASFEAHLDGQPRLLALAYIAELDWFVVSAVDLAATGVIDNHVLAAALGATLLLVLTLIVITLSGFDRLVLAPLARLNDLVRKVAGGAYDIRIGSRRHDELGELARNFDTMAARVHEHTTLLEDRVEERTRALSQANVQLGEAHRKVTDSIRYASFFQSALLPERALQEHFPGEYFVLWRPRDVVGGDLYFYRPAAGGHLLGVMDCAGHGVPGALMTMIAHAALDLALARVGADDPARLLTSFDATVRNMLPSRERFDRIATDMDIGICFIDPAAGRLRYSGARLPLYWSDNDGGGEIAGARRSIGDRKNNVFANGEIALRADRTFYLCSDGILDQNGEEQGFAFGAARLRAALQQNRQLPLAAQGEALTAIFDRYCGERAQRDDITLLAFRLPATVTPSEEQ